MAGRPISLSTCLATAFGSVGGVGGGGIFVPMLTMIIGFDPKSATAISRSEHLSKHTSRVLIPGRKKTTLKEKAAESLVPTGGNEQVEYSQLPGGPSKSPHQKDTKEREDKLITRVFTLATELYTHLLHNILAIEPIAGRKRIASKGDEGMNWKAHKLLGFFACGLLAGIVGGLLGLGGGICYGSTIFGAGNPSSGDKCHSCVWDDLLIIHVVVEYYLLNRFPIPYALYFTVVATIAAFMGQHIINKLIAMTGRASLIIYVPAFTIFVSALSLGGVGIST
ncbi:hypothetical protein GH714_036137 [Hevea brasiliensis]|uniref:Sulfite exporter TauE/SafE family protein n=1 Tax=Hevea brasiliensis TaxID=3981 RepID=A0A6A6KDF5_HEVBR|nr:hypothetical protein GH714_036137 [Hevea brasiliensis]